MGENRYYYSITRGPCIVLALVSSNLKLDQGGRNSLLHVEKGGKYGLLHLITSEAENISDGTFDLFRLNTVIHIPDHNRTVQQAQ